MIKQSTILMATPIAMMATEKGMDLHEKAGNIIRGLNETTANIVSFTEDNIATELPEYTGLVSDHTDALDAASTVVADRIRAALYTISKVVKPILVEVQKKLQNELTYNSATDYIFSAIDIDMINIEPEFLDSPFYPKEIPLSYKDINTVVLSDLLRGSYPNLSGQELVELIAVDVDMLRDFFKSPTEVKEVYDALFIEKNFYVIFNGAAVKDGIAQINYGANFAFNGFRNLVIASLLLNKLVSMDDPISGVTNVSLADYRASLAMTRDLFTTMLVHFRNQWQSRAAAGIIILSDGLKYGQNGSVFGFSRAELGDLPYFSGKLVIGYNRAVLEMFAQSDELSLTEYVLGFLYAKQRGYNVRDIITDRDTVKSAWIEYRGSINAALATNKNVVASRVFYQVIESLYSREEYKPFIDTMESDVNPNQRVMSRLSQHMDVQGFFGNITLLDSVLRGDNSFMNTLLAAKLADVFDSPIAEEILTLNANNPVGSVEQQRKALSHSIDKVIIKRLFNA